MREILIDKLRPDRFTAMSGRMAAADLNRNVLTLIEAAGPSEDEIREFGRLQRERIRRY